jgi:hypothetical protein
MNAKKILNDDISSLKVSSLPNRPSAPVSFGGRGYTAEQIKAAFDKLPLYIIDVFNNLIEDIEATGEDSLSGAIKTEIADGHSLYDMFRDIKSGDFISYVKTDGGSLEGELARINDRLRILEERINEQI